MENSKPIASVAAETLLSQALAELSALPKSDLASAVEKLCLVYPSVLVFPPLGHRSVSVFLTTM